MKALITVFLWILINCYLPGESMEFQLTFDGARRLRGFTLYSSPALSAGVSCRLDPGDGPYVSAGLNTSVFSIGHLTDTGIAAEVRNPDFTVLSRLSERTFYKADLRAESFSRLGLVLMSPSYRTGVAWERREDIDAGIIWAVPAANDSWSMEMLGEAGILRDSISDENWYPESSWRAGGPFGVAALRLRQFSSRETGGLTLIGSGGVDLRPGWLMALSYSYATGPWRVRGRAVYSSLYFRNADGEKLELPAGGSFDWRYRPSLGLQFTLDYEGGIDTRYSDEGSAAVGWRFGETQISVKCKWNRVFSNNLQGDEPACSSIKGVMIWDRKYLHLGLSGKLIPHEDWFLRLDGAFPSHGRWLMEPYAEFHGKINGDEYVPLLNLKLKSRWNIGSNRLIISLFFGDLGRDREDWPKSAGNLEAEIRWIQKFR